MHSGVINKTSTMTDILDVLTGTWADYTQGEWHICHTPFFTVFTAVLDKGKHALPFTVSVPIAGTFSTESGNVIALLVRPTYTAIELLESGIVTFQVFGDMAKLTAVR